MADEVAEVTLERRLADLGYRLTSLADRGGASTVYRAVDVDNGDDDVAIKVLPPGSDPERLRREVLILASLDHPGVVPYLDAGGFDDGTLFLVSPWLDGRTLHRLLADDGPPTTERAVALAVRIARILDDVHAAGVVHRDLTPRNIMVTADDEVTLIDFGLSRSETEATITAGADLAGTPRYLAPEVIEGASPDHRSDQYAAAVVLYELFSGRWPFPDGGTVATALHHQLHSAPIPLIEVDPGADAGVDAALQRALAKHPDERFASMADLADALLHPEDHLATVAPFGADPTAPSGPDDDWADRPVAPAGTVDAGQEVGLDAAVVAAAVAPPVEDVPPAEWSYTVARPPTRGRRRLVAAGAVAVAVIGLAAWFAVGPGLDPFRRDAALDDAAVADDDAAVATGEEEVTGDGAADGAEGDGAAEGAAAEGAAGSGDDPSATGPEGSSPSAPPTGGDGATTAAPVTAGTAASLACNLLLEVDFESGVLPVNFYSVDENPDRELILTGVGVDGSAAVRVGEPDGYGLYAESVQIVPGRSYAFSATVEKSGPVAEATLQVVWLDEGFGEIEGPERAVAVPDDGQFRVGLVTPPAPDEARYALPVLFKDASPGVLLADELVFGPADGACAPTVTG
ncbi:MAG: serine/threonine-protein kinase [Actinomycetota bacterium]